MFFFSVLLLDFVSLFIFYVDYFFFQDKIYQNYMDIIYYQMLCWDF